MKWFKKLAAAVLVAALALMMVGCGGSKTGLAQQVKNAVSDDAVMRNEQATNSEGAEWPNLQELLDDETFLQKFGIDPEKDAYKVSLVYVPSYISDTMNQFKPFSLADQLRRDADLTIGDPHIGRKFEFGLAIGTLDGENWVLMLMK